MQQPSKTSGELVRARPTALHDRIWDLAHGLRDQLVHWRRDIHRHPELSYEERRTTALVAQALRDMGIEANLHMTETGVIAEVNEFAKVTPAAGATPILANPAKQVQQMDVQFNRQAAAEAKAAGSAPIRVKLPVNGKLYKLEKILALPQDKLFFTVQYKGWKVAK